MEIGVGNAWCMGMSNPTILASCWATFILIYLNSLALADTPRGFC